MLRSRLRFGSASLCFTPQILQEARLDGHEDVYRVVRINYAGRVVDLASSRYENITLRNVPFRDLIQRPRHLNLLRVLKTQFAKESFKGRLAMIISVPLVVGFGLLLELMKFLKPPPEVVLRQRSSEEFLADVERVVSKVLSRGASVEDRK